MCAALNGGDGSLDGGDSLAHQSLSPMLHPENEEEETIIEEEDYNANRRRSLSAGSDTLYKVLGVVLGSLVLILVICSVFCFLRQRQLVKRQGNNCRDTCYYIYNNSQDTYYYIYNNSLDICYYLLP